MKKGWQTKKLSEVCDKITDGTHQTPTYFDDGTLFLSSRNVTSGTIDWENVKYIDAKQHGEMQRRVSPRLNDILLAKNGTTGVAAMVDRDVPFDIYVSLALLRPLAAVRPTFLLHFINSPLAKEQFTKRLKGVGVPNLHLKEIREVVMPVPPLAEQQRIVGILNEAFAGLATAKANAEKNLQNARALFEGHLQSVFTQIHDAYTCQNLKSLCERITKGSSPKWQGIQYVDSPGVLFVTSENVRENRVVIDPPKYVDDKFNLKERRSILEPGDVLTNLVGASIGRTAVYDREPGANINQAVGLIRCVPNQLYNYYLMYYLNSPVMKDFLHSNEVNNARANISLTFVSELKIPLPPLTFQTELVARIQKIEAETKRLESIYTQKLAAIEALKKSLLHQAFTGQLIMDN